MSSSHRISGQAEEWIQRFIFDLRTKEDLNPKTLNHYASDLRHFAQWIETSWNEHQEQETLFDPAKIATPMMIRYREFMQTVISLKPTTINRRLNTLKRFFFWATQEGIISINVSKPVKLVEEEKTSPMRMTDWDESSLVGAVQKFGNLRDQTLILLMLHTGLRSMEVCDVTLKDIQLGKRSGNLHVIGKRNKHRDVPLNATIRNALEIYLATLPENSEFLFVSEKTGGRLGERGLRYIIQKYMKYAKLEFSAHDLRHRFGYVMAERTPLHRLAQIMGHDSLDTTMIYVQATQADLQTEVEKIAWT
ncbi:tyrosine-type recombinase/integrase [Baia soyae]|uniref:Integrase/recombinase XerC n=1 Tax=Baia soyae TaxID=1544746 RepID=A0A4V2SWG6_9BACL|nr:tyrosine-type recombinase/integrase [Baia soyae]TCP62156.1 integrase/recombinase XerC [Baia soyae]